MNSIASSSFGGRLLIGATGSAAVAALPIGSITVVMTHTAAIFLPAHSVALFADSVVEGGHTERWARENHATLAEEHDMMAVLPATANMLAVAASGGAPDLLSAMILAAEFPVVFFPVMTAHMWQKPAVQRNVEQLRKDDRTVVDPPKGQRYDVGLDRVVEGPMPPSPSVFIDKIRELMPTTA